MTKPNGMTEIMEEFENIPFITEDALICPKCRTVFPVQKFKGANIACPKGCRENNDIVAVMSAIWFYRIEAKKFLQSALQKQREQLLEKIPNCDKVFGYPIIVSDDPRNEEFNRGFEAGKAFIKTQIINLLKKI